MKLCAPSKLGISVVSLVMSAAALAGCVSETGDDDSRQEEGALPEDAHFEPLPKGGLTKSNRTSNTQSTSFQRLISPATTDSPDGRTWDD